MKAPVLILTIVSCFFLFINCNKQESSVDSASLNGIWYMQSVQGGLMGVNLNYNPGEVYWMFNNTSNKLIVVNNATVNSSKHDFARFSTGTYNFKDSVFNGETFLFIDDSEIGVLNFSQATLTLDDGLASDGFVTTFER